MDIKQLKYLIALDRTRHFGQAAAACHITQPTLSMRIRSLEEELNLTLIQRGQRFEGFTPEGERILAWARAVLAAHDGLAAEAAIVAMNIFIFIFELSLPVLGATMAPRPLRGLLQ